MRLPVIGDDSTVAYAEALFYLMKKYGIVHLVIPEIERPSSNFSIFWQRTDGDLEIVVRPTINPKDMN